MSDKDDSVGMLLNQSTSSLLQNGQVVKVDNSFNKTHAFNRLSATEQNVSWAIISMFSTGDTDKNHSKVLQFLTVSSTDIRNLAGIGSNGSRITKNEYRKTLDKLRQFFLTQYFVVHIKEGEMLLERGTPIFKHFDILNNGEQIYLELMPESTHFFSKIFEGIGFTVFGLQKMIDIPTPTAKTLYRLFLDGKHLNGWNATYKEICEEFGYKNRSAFYTFFRRLPEYIEQVNKTGDFSFLHFQPIRDESKRGHPIVSIYFTIRVKPDRIKKLVRHYHPQKPKKKPVFYALSVDKNVSADLLNANADGTVSAFQMINKKTVEVKCPQCGALVYAFIQSSDGKVGFACGNSNFWHLGNQDCGFYASAEQSARLTDDMKLWVQQMKKNNDDLATCLQNLAAGQEEISENKTVVEDVEENEDKDNPPFPVE